VERDDSPAGPDEEQQKPCLPVMVTQHNNIKTTLPIQPALLSFSGELNQIIIFVLIYKTYIGETHYKLWLDFSQHASIPRHHPLCAMSPSTIRHVIIHQITYLCLKSIFCGL
jgi:hypothetical protein